MVKPYQHKGDAFFISLLRRKIGKRIENKVDNVEVSYILVENCKVEETSGDQKRKIYDGIEGEIEKIKNDEITKKVVRDILRFGKYKPSGRGNHQVNTFLNHI